MGLMYFLGFTLLGVFMAFGIPIAVDSYRRVGGAPSPVERQSSAPVASAVEPIVDAVGEPSSHEANLNSPASISAIGVESGSYDLRGAVEIFRALGKKAEFSPDERASLLAQSATVNDFMKLVSRDGFVTSSADVGVLAEVRISADTLPKVIADLARRGAFNDKKTMDEVIRAVNALPGA